MSEKIEPALSAGEWADYFFCNERYGGPFMMPYKKEIGGDEAECRRLIALNNAALPASDPRKITREWIEGLRVVADETEKDTIALFEGRDPGRPDRYIALLRRIADALESYLRPEEG